MQQVPSGEIGKMIRSCFKADKGSKLLSVDFSNLEVQIGARVFGDEALIKMLEAGINMHDENTRIFFGIDKDSPRWPSLRKVSKIIMFGRLLYGGSDNGIYSQVMTEVPDCGLTLPVFKGAVQNYFKAHPEFAEWMTTVQTMAKDHKLSVNAFGRVRSLLGPLQSIKRQALNSPIQGSAADAVRDDMILINEAFSKGQLNSKLLLQVHDELIFEVPDEELDQMTEMVPRIMATALTLDVPLKVDLKTGSNWGRLEKVS